MHTPVPSNTRWRKSSLTGGEHCVELPVWRKSSMSGGGENCVELTRGAVRDSKNQTGPVLVADVPSLVDAVKAGRVGL